MWAQIFTAKITLSLKNVGLGINITLHIVLLACQYLPYLAVTVGTLILYNTSDGGCECQQELADLRGRVKHLETQLSYWQNLTLPLLKEHTHHDGGTARPCHVYRMCTGSYCTIKGWDITITAIVFTQTLEMTGAPPVCSVNDDSILTNITTNSESASDEE